MEQILIIREVLVKFFKRYEVFILPILKFLLGLFVFTNILSIGYVHSALEPFAEQWSPTLLSVLFALLFTIMPANMGWLLIILSVTVQLSANIEIAVAVFVFLLFVFAFYARMAPKESILILFTILAFHFNVPYLIPILAGLYFPITAIIPITVGVFVNAQIPILFGLVQHSPTTAGAMADMEIADILTELPEAFSVVYETLVHSLAVTHTWLFTAVVFAMVIVLVHFISRLSIDYAKEIAIALGCVMNIFGFIVAVLIAGESANIGLVIIMTILCGILAGLVRCFDAILDYQRAESVQFEDDNNFYHVRIVPKVILSKSQRVVKRIRPTSETDLPKDERLAAARRTRSPQNVSPARNLDIGRRPRPDMPRHEGVPPVRRRPLPPKSDKD
ncbi:MAG: hypothetical protein FWC32_11565 [Firmicutes bacterium]|nr:hypothetical protein [Bacillota bacterium]